MLKDDQAVYDKLSSCGPIASCTNLHLCEAETCAPACLKSRMTWKIVWQCGPVPPPPPPLPPCWASCSEQFAFASVFQCFCIFFFFFTKKQVSFLFIYLVILIFKNNPNSCASSIMYFTFRGKKAHSWFVTRATWESTQCRSSQRHWGNHLHFLFNQLNKTIQMMSTVQSGSIMDTLI